jgi:hypothetical protein
MHDGVLQMLGHRALAPSVARWVFPRGERPIDDGFDGTSASAKRRLGF